MQLETEGKKKLQMDVKMNKTTKMKILFWVYVILTIVLTNMVRLAHIHGLVLTHSSER